MNIIEYILTKITNITSLILINNRLCEVVSKNHKSNNHKRFLGNEKQNS